jgi:hypothetical protein
MMLEVVLRLNKIFDRHHNNGAFEQTDERVAAQHYSIIHSTAGKFQKVEKRLCTSEPSWFAPKYEGFFIIRR